MVRLSKYEIINIKIVIKGEKGQVPKKDSFPRLG